MIGKRRLVAHPGAPLQLRAQHHVTAVEHERSIGVCAGALSQEGLLAPIVQWPAVNLEPWRRPAPAVAPARRPPDPH